MSITYDPKKWTNPLWAHDFENTRKKSKSPVLVSLRELRYFKTRNDSILSPIGIFLSEDEEKSAATSQDANLVRQDR